jgi:hypothetical protein
MERSFRALVLGALIVVAGVSLQGGTLVTVTCDVGDSYQQFSDPSSTSCSLNVPPGTPGGSGIATAAGTVAPGSLSVSSYALSLDPTPYGTAQDTWTTIFPTTEVLTWWITWDVDANYLITLNLDGQYAPLTDWISQGLTSAYFQETVPANAVSFVAYSQDTGEGSASLTATLVSTVPSVPEPGTFLTAAVVLLGLGLLGRRSTR